MSSLSRLLNRYAQFAAFSIALAISACVMTPGPYPPPQGPAYYQPPPPITSPEGDQIRQTATIGTVATILTPVLHGGRPSLNGIFRAGQYFYSMQVAASLADQEYARKIARTYSPKTNAPYLAVRTPSSKRNATPDVVVVKRSTGEVQSAYKLQKTPASGQELKLQNTLMCEYVP